MLTQHGSARFALVIGVMLTGLACSGCTSDTDKSPSDSGIHPSEGGADAAIDSSANKDASLEAGADAAFPDADALAPDAMPDADAASSDAMPDADWGCKQFTDPQGSPYCVCSNPPPAGGQEISFYNCSIYVEQDYDCCSFDGARCSCFHGTCNPNERSVEDCAVICPWPEPVMGSHCLGSQWKCIGTNPDYPDCLCACTCTKDWVFECYNCGTCQ